MAAFSFWFCQKLVGALWNSLGSSYGSARADKAAEVAAYTLLSNDVRFALTVKLNGLVSAVSAGDVAAAATKALLSVYGWHDKGLTVQEIRTYK